MKKEDFTTRLLRNLFHIQGPFDECRQEIIYKACARSMVQIVYSSFFLFLFYLLFGRFIEAVRYAMPYVYSGLIFFITLKTQRAVKELHLEFEYILSFSLIFERMYFFFKKQMNFFKLD